MKGRGTRTFTFKYRDENGQEHTCAKSGFHLFDFFANCEYFEEDFNYDECLQLPREAGARAQPLDEALINYPETVEVFDPDRIRHIAETAVGADGMKVDRMYFDSARKLVQADGDVRAAVESEQWERAVRLLRERYEDKPELYLTLEKIRRSQNLDRRLTWREFLERVFGLIDAFPTREQKLEEEVAQFIAIHKPESRYVSLIRNYMKAYLTDERFRDIINRRVYGELAVYPGFSLKEFHELDHWREAVPAYIKDYVPINQFMQ